MAAFNEVCPDRFDLIHKHYRKMCQMLVDVDEWGVVWPLALLTSFSLVLFYPFPKPRSTA